MTFSVAIPVYNGLNHLKKNFPSVVSLRADEIVVVDDCSQDNSAEWLRKKYPLVKIIPHPQNTGFPRSANDAVANCASSVVILLNQDVKPAGNLITVIKNEFKQDDIFAVTFNEGHNSWANLTICDGMISFQNGQDTSSVHDSFWASGGSAAFRKSMWDKLGGFDALFSPGYFEDLDLSWRARKKGWRIIWHPQAKVSHPHPQSSFDREFDPRRLDKIKMRNFFLVQWKNFSRRQLLIHFLFLPKFLFAHPGQLTAFLMAVRRTIAGKFFGKDYA